jgi:predicted O-linked N-acetylglucosamine transferase (SPINDLY family)
VREPADLPAAAPCGASSVAATAPLPSARELVDEGLRQRQQQRSAAAALPFFERAAQLEPDSHLPFLMLGNALSELGELDAAVLQYQRARDIQPANAVIRHNLGLMHMWRGYIDAAIQELGIACRQDPAYLKARSMYILALHYSDRITAEEIATSIREWAGCFARQYPEQAQPERADHSGRLRIGFLSGDFRTHSVAHFFEPIASARDRDAFEYVFYSNCPDQDAVTGRIRSCADSWRDVWQLGDAALIQQIQADRIDILVDLSGHTEFNRLAVFARRAAPVQVSYLGFPNSTGMPTMDYRITDAETDPQPLADGLHSERLLRLPDAQWCFRPFGAITAPAPLPAREAGFVTFGSFNNLSKVSDTLLRCWKEILGASTTSRLCLTRVRSSTRAAEIIAEFEEAGIARERIQCVPYRGDVPHGRQYAGVDIALDHYPYNGVTTTCETLYAGVPVVSLQGRHCVSRSGLSILRSVGLGELVASTPEQYVRIALDLAGSLPRLERLRAELRDRLERSPLRDEKRFAANFEELLRTAWRLHRNRTDRPLRAAQDVSAT